jgi:hypothetical protein
MFILFQEPEQTRYQVTTLIGTAVAFTSKIWPDVMLWLKGNQLGKRSMGEHFSTSGLFGVS